MTDREMATLGDLEPVGVRQYVVAKVLAMLGAKAKGTALATKVRETEMPGETDPVTATRFGKVMAMVWRIAMVTVRAAPNE